jgi:hypothetical protein
VLLSAPVFPPTASYTHTEPPYTYTEPPYTHAELRYTYTELSYTHTEPSYTHTGAIGYQRDKGNEDTRRSP